MHIGEVAMTLTALCAHPWRVFTSQTPLGFKSDKKNLCGEERQERLAKMGLLRIS